MFNLFRSLWAVALLAMVSSTTAYAAEWYLAPDGNDGNACLDKETPCKTIQEVLKKLEFSAGDKMLLRKGTYDLAGKTSGYGKVEPDIAFEVYGGYDPTYKNRDEDASKTILTSSAASDNGRLFAFRAGRNLPIIFDSVKFADFKQVGRTDSGLITTYTGNEGKNVGAWLKFNNVIFENNEMTGAVAIDLATAGDILEISNSAFINNSSSSSAKILYLREQTKAIVYNSVFSNNTLIGGGNVIYAKGADLNLENVTVVGNTVTGSTIATSLYTSGAATLSCIHCTVANFDSTSTHYLVHAADSSSISLKNSFIASEGGNTINFVNANQIKDLGYNAIGINGSSGVRDDAHPASSSTSAINSEINLANIYKASDENIYEVQVENNGGAIPSLKPSSMTSSVIDRIPNDMPALLTGISPQTPFTSLAQAHNALKGYGHYKKQKYFFAIGGQSFSTVVDNEGWVLVASGNRLQMSGEYAETYNLEERADLILNRAVLEKSGFVFDEVKITTRDQQAVNLDVRSASPKVISALKDFRMLPNNYVSSSEPDLPYGNGGWYPVSGGLYISHISPDDNNLSGQTNDGVVKNLNQIIYEAKGKSQGIYWMPDNGGHIETLRPGMNTVDFNLWVRSSDLFCGGIVSTDQRGMPRPKLVNPNDPNQYGLVNDCDIGSFEWNNAYKLDCFDEDGERPENTIKETYVTFCINNLADVTPKAIIDNLGHITWYYLALLSAVMLLRRRKLLNTGK